MNEFKQIYESYKQLKSERERYRALWDDISKISGIGVRPDYIYDGNEDKARTADEYVDDPTSAISVNQFGDYLLGIMWGTGKNAFTLVPSRYVLERSNPAEVESYFDFITQQTLYHMIHEESGLNNALKAYAYDQASFGTSGIGAFENPRFKSGVDDNAIFFRAYGIDNICIDEGKNGNVEIVFATYHWRVNRIISEFCCNEIGDLDEAKIANLPDEIKRAYEKGKLNDKFTLVFGVFPRNDYNPKLMGKRGTKYKGVWFLEKSEHDNKIFATYDYSSKPIAVARMIKLRGEIYGRSSGSMLLSSIKAVNFMVGTAIEAIEKMTNPALGIMNNAIFGDAVLDVSPQGLTTFNQAAMGQNGQPIFPLYDVGDPSALIQFLIPYLNEKIVSAFKIDALLDFNSAQQMTATESLQRYAIRGKSLAGILIQQKTECLAPLVKRCVTLLGNVGELGVNPETFEERAKILLERGRPERVIPQSVVEVMREGRAWFEIQFNNELEKMTKTETIEALVQILQAVGGIASMYPQIIEAVNWYQMLKDINDNLDANNQLLISEDEFRNTIEQMKQQQQAMVALGAGQVGAQIEKDSAAANKQNREAISGVR
jgi:hypothetical protein